MAEFRDVINQYLISFVDFNASFGITISDDKNNVNYDETPSEKINFVKMQEYAKEYVKYSEKLNNILQDYAIKHRLSDDKLMSLCSKILDELKTVKSYASIYIQDSFVYRSGIYSWSSIDKTEGPINSIFEEFLEFFRLLLSLKRELYVK